MNLMLMKCDGVGCPLTQSCWHFSAEIDRKNDWWWGFSPYREEKNHCSFYKNIKDLFFETDERKIQSRIS